jgi:hypothetical protein
MTRTWRKRVSPRAAFLVGRLAQCASRLLAGRSVRTSRSPQDV